MREILGGRSTVLAALSLVAFAFVEGSAAAPPPPSSEESTAGVAVALPGDPEEAAGLAPAARVRAHLQRDPFSLISRARLLGTLDELTAIGADALFRTSGSRGEAEAFDFVAARLGTLAFLATGGLEVERQRFRIYLAGEVWEARLFLTLATDGQEREVPAHVPQGHRDDLAGALRFDSDGVPGDLDRDPVEAEGPALLVRSAGQLASLTAATAQGRVVLLDYALVDRALLGTSEATARAARLLALGPAAVVTITSFSNAQGVSHGSFAGDLGAFTLVSGVPARPVLIARLEDLARAGIASWNDLAGVRSARLRWDADVVAPGASQNLIARIPGRDSSAAVILGAHLDSANSPGAMDDGGGAVALLEAARVLDEAHQTPPVDVYLAWFGSHERGLFGSANFAATHQELLDRALAMLQMDCLRRPLDGLSSDLTLEAWSSAVLGDPRLLWPSYLRQAASLHGLWPGPFDYAGFSSDNTNLLGFDVPNANLIYLDPDDATEVHYGGHLHDPYDTSALVRDVAPVLDDMTRVVLTAALATGRDRPALRLTPTPNRRAVFVASHTEAPQMGPSAMVEFGMALAKEGVDVDTIPYGTPVTSEDLRDAAVVIALPVHDYPSAAGGAADYEERWTDAEVAALDGYVADGGFLILTNSGSRLKYGAQRWEANEDWAAGNAVASRFGVTWLAGSLPGAGAISQGSSPLLSGVAGLALAAGNGVPFAVRSGQVLARAGTQSAVALVRPNAAGGEVLVVADLAMLTTSADISPVNLPFWRNLARYVRNR
ncbi:MAG: Zn-dependent exopeptidase M28 [Acidobacteria bacterium]|nr:MAG: Zn-dependent exopeptidase M28 [Acidobacteriota bacterium]